MTQILWADLDHECHTSLLIELLVSEVHIAACVLRFGFALSEVLVVAEVAVAATTVVDGSIVPEAPFEPHSLGKVDIAVLSLGLTHCILRQ